MSPRYLYLGMFSINPFFHKFNFLLISLSIYKIFYMINYDNLLYKNGDSVTYFEYVFNYKNGEIYIIDIKLFFTFFSNSELRLLYNVIFN